MLGISHPSLLPDGEFPSVSALPEHWQEETEILRYYHIADLTSARLQDAITLTATRGSTLTNPLWQI